MRFISTDQTGFPSRNLTLLSAGSVLTIAAPAVAQAHVKWFCNYDVAEQPRVLDHVVDTDFVALTVLAISLMVAGCVIDHTEYGEAISRALDRVTTGIRTNALLLVRVTCGFFLIALWTMGGIILTPELKTTSVLVSYFQLAMAASLVSRRTTPFAGFGIFVLYGLGLYYYGFFHLLDYPIFLGVGAFLIMTCWRGSGVRLPFQPVELLRWPAAITLMWASIEKWAYPDWTMPLYLSHPAMSMGYDFELFMRAAGVIEFTLAFALLWSPLVRRASAFILTGMFISAIAEFGKIDAVGHSLIIAVLLVLASDSSRAGLKVRAWRSVAEPALSYAVALVAFLSLYYGVHALLFGTAIT